MDLLHRGQDQVAKGMLEEMVSQQKRRISLQEVVAYFGIRAFADDVRFERDEGLGRATVVALKETLWHKWHSDQVETRDQNNCNQKQFARPGEYRRYTPRRIHIHGLR